MLDIATGPSAPTEFYLHLAEQRLDDNQLLPALEVSPPPRLRTMPRVHRATEAGRCVKHSVALGSTRGSTRSRRGRGSDTRCTLGSTHGGVGEREAPRTRPQPDAHTPRCW